MTLHEAIAQLLRQYGKPLTENEIADKLYKNKWYIKADRSPIKGSQISARVDNHHELFVIDRSVSPLKIKLFNTKLKAKSEIIAQEVEQSKPATTSNNINTIHLKISFEPICNPEIQILILG